MPKCGGGHSVAPAGGAAGDDSETDKLAFSPSAYAAGGGALRRYHSLFHRLMYQPHRVLPYPGAQQKRPNSVVESGAIAEAPNFRSLEISTAELAAQTAKTSA